MATTKDIKLSLDSHATIAIRYNSLKIDTLSRRNLTLRLPHTHTRMYNYTVIF